MTKEDSFEYYKNTFLIYFDGSYYIESQPDTPSTYSMGLCKFEFIEKDETTPNILIVHVRRPGILIGKGGRCINALKEVLGCEIEIKEVKL